MFIAFEGPDNVGKTTTAAKLSHNGRPIYNATKSNYQEAQKDLTEPDLVQTFDRIDWFTHMVYRLAYPHRDWNDDRPRTVFAMPDTHFVLKVHNPGTVALVSDLEDGIAAGKLEAANDMYIYQFWSLLNLNEFKDFFLYKTMSIVEVTYNPQTGEFDQKMIEFSSPTVRWGRYKNILPRMVDSDDALLEFLREEDHQIG